MTDVERNLTEGCERCRHYVVRRRCVLAPLEKFCYRGGVVAWLKPQFGKPRECVGFKERS